MRAKTIKAGRTVFTTTALFTAMLLAGSVTADSVGEPGRGSGKSNPLNNVYFGEQHMHMADSALITNESAFILPILQSSILAVFASLLPLT